MAAAALNPSRARTLLKAMGRRRVLVLGDVMLDEFIWGKVVRISPEAPVPVVEVTSQSFHLGGAGNVAANVRSLGGQAVLLGVVGRDFAAERVRDSLAAAGVESLLVAADSGRPTTMKTRIIAHHQQVVRADREIADDISDPLEDQLIGHLRSALPGCGALVLSDYQKGVVTPRIMKAVLSLARRHKVPVLVDPKVRHFGLYRGVSVVTPNHLEAEHATGMRIRNENDLRAAGARILRLLRCQAALVTRGEQGMSLFQPGARTVHIPTAAREVYDVTGAGDTVIATAALAMGAGARLEQAARLANFAAGVVVGKIGTATASPAEVLAAVEAAQAGVKVGIVGAGPAGSLLGYLLARQGVSATIFDASHPREKPCGGGLTQKALALLPAAPPDDPLPARFLDECRFESGEGQAVDLALDRPVAVASRAECDAWLLRQAVAAGARHLPARVTAVSAQGLVQCAGQSQTFDVVVGADGAGSLVRRTLLSPTPPARLTMAAGWFAAGDAPMLIRFTPGLAGYLWLFPRRDHVGVGICAPLGQTPTRSMLGRLEAEVARSFPALTSLDADRYAHTIPSPSSDPRSLLEIAGDRWALLGDAAALADPITGEGIYYALRSAVLLAETLAAEGSPRRYPERVLSDFGAELLKAVALRDRFYAPGFARRMIAFSARSPAIRGVLGDLVLGDQGYTGLKRRLLAAGPRFVWESTPGPAVPRRVSARPALPPTVRALGVVSLLTDASSEMIWPLLPAFVTGVLGAGPTFLGLVEGLAEAVASALKLVSGRISDRLEQRKPLILAGYGLSSLARPLVALASLPWHVLAVRVVDRIGKGVRGAPRDALIAEAVAPALRGRAYGFHRAMDHAGAVLGPLLASAVLYFRNDLRLVFALAAIPAALSVLFLIFGVQDPGRSGEARPVQSPGWVRPRGALLRYLGVLALFTLGNSTDAFLLLRAQQAGVSLAAIPLLWSFHHVIKSAASTHLGALSDRTSRRTAIAIGWAVYAACYAGFAVASTPLQVFALFAVYGLFFALTEGPERALVADLADPAARGSAFGFYHAVTGAMLLPASLLTGALWQAWGAEAALLTGAACAGVSAIALFALVGEPSPRSAS